MIPRALMMTLLLGCGSGKEDPASTDTDNGEDSGGTGTPDLPTWSLMADELGEGSLLSGWTDQGITHMVGGDMHGGPGLRVAYDGDSLCIEAEITERALWWIHGDRPGRWVAVGEAGTAILEEDGVRSRIDIPSEANFYGVWVTEDAITAVGGSIDAGTGEVWQYSDGGWDSLATGLPGVAFKIWEDWIVGVGISYRLESDHSLTDLGDAGRLLTVRGDGQTVTAVGGMTSSLVVQHNGTDWTELGTDGLGQPLTGVWTGPGADVWVTGNFGTMGRLVDGEWDIPEWPVTSHHFHAVWPHSADEVLFVGGNFMSSGANFGTIGRYGPERESPEVGPCE